MAIVEILRGGEPMRQQSDIVEKLREMGIPSTQSSVSRDLAQLRAVRIKDRWLLAGGDDRGGFARVATHVKEVRSAGPHQTLLVTDPGAGAFVAQAIDDSGWEEIEGTVSGLSSVLLLTRDGSAQKLLAHRLAGYLRDEEAEAGE